MEIISSKEHTSLVRKMEMILFLIYFFNRLLFFTLSGLVTQFSSEQHKRSRSLHRAKHT